MRAARPHHRPPTPVSGAMAGLVAAAGVAGEARLRPPSPTFVLGWTLPSRRKVCPLRARPRPSPRGPRAPATPPGPRATLTPRTARGGGAWVRSSRNLHRCAVPRPGRPLPGACSRPLEDRPRPRLLPWSRLRVTLQRPRPPSSSVPWTSRAFGNYSRPRAQGIPRGRPSTSGPRSTRRSRSAKQRRISWVFVDVFPTCSGSSSSVPGSRGRLLLPTFRLRSSWRRFMRLGFRNMASRCCGHRRWPRRPSPAPRANTLRPSSPGRSITSLRLCWSANMCFSTLRLSTWLWGFFR